MMTFSTARDLDNLVNFRCEQVERCDNGSVGSQIVFFHYFFVFNRISNIDVGTKRHLENSRIQVYHIWRSFLDVEMRVETLHERGLARPGHADTYDGVGHDGKLTYLR